MNNYILEYWQGIVNGEIIVGEDIKTWYTMVVKRIESGEYTYSPKLAKKVIVYIENFCRHHQGPLAPGKIKLELWYQKERPWAFATLDGRIKTQDGKTGILEIKTSTPNG